MVLPGCWRVWFFCLVLTLPLGLAAPALAQSFASDAPLIRDDYLQDLWLMARADYRAGRERDAMELLQAILQQRPAWRRVRLELAQMAYESSDYVLAREQLQRLLSSPTLATPLRDAAGRLLQRLERVEQSMAQRHVWSAFAALGGMYDDNVNAGPLSDLVEIDNERFFVKPEFTPRSDWATILRASLAHRYRFDAPRRLDHWPARFYWESQAIGSRKVYLHEKDYNLDILALRTGPWFSVSDALSLSLPLRIDAIRFGGASYATFASCSPLLTWRSGSAKWSLEFHLLHKDYRQGGNQGREGDYRSVALRFDHPLFSPKLNVHVGVRLSEEDTRDFNYSNEGYEWFGGLAFSPSPAWRATLEVRRRSLEYQGESALFLTDRQDDQDWLNLGLQYRPTGRLLGATPSIEAGYAFIRRDSSIPLFTYERSQVYLALRLLF